MRLHERHPSHPILTLTIWTVLLSTTLHPRAEGDDDSFILVLEYVGSDSGFNNSSSSSSNSSPAEDVCLEDPEGNSECMCGDRSESITTQRALLENSAVSGSAPVMVRKLDFCNDALYRLGYVVKWNRTSDLPSQTDDETCNTTQFVIDFTSRELQDKIEELTSTLQQFDGVLNRTIVGVYLQSNDDRSVCLVRLTLCQNSCCD